MIIELLQESSYNMSQFTIRSLSIPSYGRTDHNHRLANVHEKFESYELVYIVFGANFYGRLDLVVAQQWRLGEGPSS